jgi:phosphopantetheine adenylyltransferase
MGDTMTRRCAAAFLVMAVLGLGPALQVFAHEGHDHKVMGTVTMAAADHVMLKDKAGKDVTIQVTSDTKVKAKTPTKVEDIKPGTRIVVTAIMEKDVMKAKLIEIGVAAATAANATKK